jgi:hypothetical protein
MGDLQGALRDTKEPSAVVRSSAKFPRLHTAIHARLALHQAEVDHASAQAGRVWVAALQQSVDLFLGVLVAGFDVLDDVLEHGHKLLPLHRKLPQRAVAVEKVL